MNRPPSRSKSASYASKLNFKIMFRIWGDSSNSTERHRKKEKRGDTDTQGGRTLQSRARAAICIAAEKAWKPSRSRLSGLSDLHARQVHDCGVGVLRV